MNAPLLLLCLASVASSAEYEDGIFTSNADLQDLLYTESQLVAGMNRYIQEEEARLDKLKQ